MRPMTSALLLVLLAATFASGSAQAEKVRCSAIRDSAMCAAESSCWFDVNRRHCFDGPAPKQDACAVHEGESLCATDTVLGCAWDAAAQKCVTKSN